MIDGWIINTVVFGALEINFPLLRSFVKTETERSFPLLLSEGIGILLIRSVSCCCCCCWPALVNPESERSQVNTEIAFGWNNNRKLNLLSWLQTIKRFSSLIFAFQEAGFGRLAPTRGCGLLASLPAGQNRPESNRIARGKKRVANCEHGGCTARQSEEPSPPIRDAINLILPAATCLWIKIEPLRRW